LQLAVTQSKSCEPNKQPGILDEEVASCVHNINTIARATGLTPAMVAQAIYQTMEHQENVFE
jgi:hypothetical protein